MLKYIALLINTIALLVYQFFFAEGITITQNMPASAKPETEFVAELVINKGSTSGFAKLQLDLPEGFTASQDENNGASFTFSNQSVKYIWMSLPAEKEFKIKYKVKVAAGVSGSKSISGKFSYVADNVKQTVDVNAFTINILGDTKEPIASAPPVNNEPVATVTTPTPTPTPEPVNVTPASEPTPEPVVEAVPVSNSDPSSVVCTRKIISKSPNDAIVELVINKGNVNGFAKLLETIPDGCVASLNEAQGASFTFSEGKAKFVWVSMPTTPEFKISYKLSISNPSTIQFIEGVFTFIENDETKKYVIPATKVSESGTSSQPVVTNTPPANNTPAVETPVATTTQEETPVATTTQSNNTSVQETNKEPVVVSQPATNNLSATSIPAPQSNVNYKVQIAALQNAVGINVLANRYGINEKINMEMTGGLTKYTIGSHNEYKSARDAREVAKNKGIQGAFVTAYNAGNRITVQEALMITKQNWYR